MTRQDIPTLLPPESIAVELGVAEGKFSEELLKHPNIKTLYSIDIWAGDRGHDDKEYKRAIARLQPYGERSVVIRKTFSEAVSAFPDNYFNLVYIDGYAHACDGSAFREWWPKCRHIFAGHDYSKEFPLVIAEVDKFAKDHDRDVEIIPAEPGWYKFPSWLIHK